MILSSNDIGDNGAARLAGALRVNTTLTKLDLAENGIGNLGTARLADALKSNTILKELNLSTNDIDKDGFPSLVDALGHNATLEELYLLGMISSRLDPVDIDDPRDKAVVTDLLRLEREGRVFFRHKPEIPTVSITDLEALFPVDTEKYCRVKVSSQR